MTWNKKKLRFVIGIILTPITTQDLTHKSKLKYFGFELLLNEIYRSLKVLKQWDNQHYDSNDVYLCKKNK